MFSHRKPTLVTPEQAHEDATTALGTALDKLQTAHDLTHSTQALHEADILRLQETMAQRLNRVGELSHLKTVLREKIEHIQRLVAD